MTDAGEQTARSRVPARFLPYESRAMTYRSDTRKLVRALLITTLICGALAALSFVVGERSIVEWAKAQGGDIQSRGFISFLLRMPRFFMYAVFALFLVIGLDRRQRVWVHIALIVLVLELVFAGGLVRLLKAVIGRARPTMPPGFSPFSLADDWQSLPSGESADVTASVSFFLYFARTNKVRLLMLAAVAMVMFERLMVGEHHPSDVLAGAYLLLVISFVVWHWFVVGFPIKRVRVWLRQDEPPDESLAAAACCDETDEAEAPEDGA
jgi:undecaprenyl-diphosphatase